MTPGPSDLTSGAVTATGTGRPPAAVHGRRAAPSSAGTPPADAVAQLTALARRGTLSSADVSRAPLDLPAGAAARRAAVLVLFGVAATAPAGPAAAPASPVPGSPAPGAPAPGSAAPGSAAPGSPDAGLLRGEDLDVLLVHRASTLTHHPGQVSFPGGRIEQDDDGPVAAALREAEEETGLVPAGVEVLGALPELPVAASRHLVTPVLGWWAVPSAVRATDPAETAAVARVPVAALTDPANRRTAARPGAGRGPSSPAFLVDGLLVWGFTAYVLDRLLAALGWAVPWDPSRTVDPYAG